MAVVGASTIELIFYPEGITGPDGEIGLWSSETSLTGDASGGTATNTTLFPATQTYYGFSVDYVAAQNSDAVVRAFEVSLTTGIPGFPVIVHTLLTVIANGVGRAHGTTPIESPRTIYSPGQGVSAVGFVMVADNPGASIVEVLRVTGRLFKNRLAPSNR